MKFRAHGTGIVLGGMLLLCGDPALAAVGQVLFALGRVEIQRGDLMLAAARGTPVEQGDFVSTGPTGFVQLRLKDGALVSLKSGARMQIEEFRLPAPEPPPVDPVPAAVPAPVRAPSAAETGGRSVLRLLKGAFRTVTGAIGKGAGDLYRVSTPTATIGIRGTDYSVAYCSGDCGATPDGLYVGVSNGEIFVSNEVGELVLGDNQYAYVRDPTTPPEQQMVPPEVLETPIETQEGDKDEDSGEEPDSGEGQRAGEGASPASGDSAGAAKTLSTGASNPEGTYELRPTTSGSYAFATGPFAPKQNFAGAGNNGVYADSNGGLSGFFGLDSSGRQALYSIGSSQNVNRGFDPSTGLQWGRWSGGTASAGSQSLDLTKSSLHWIYVQQSGTLAIPITGTLKYSLIGNTNPTDNAGNVGFLGSASFSACFNCGNSLGGLGTVDSSLSIGINDQAWSASGTGSIVGNSNLFAGDYSIVTAGAVSGTGSFAGFFTSNAAGAGLGYSLSDGSSMVSGTAAFGNPTAPPALVTDGPR